MKRIIWLILIAVTAVGCSKDESNSESRNDETPFTIEGKWYVSACSEGYLTNDSTKYHYDEKIIGYEEYTFKLIEGEENYYSVKSEMRSIRRKAEESDNDYVARIQNGNYTEEELEKISLDCYNWFISDSYIYIPWNGKKYKGSIVGKIVQSTYSKFTIASVSPFIYDFWGIEPPTLQYYITLTRIQ